MQTYDRNDIDFTGNLYRDEFGEEKYELLKLSEFVNKYNYKLKKYRKHLEIHDKDFTWDFGKDTIKDSEIPSPG